MAERPPDESEPSSNAKGGCGPIAFSLIFVVVGLLIIVQAAGGPNFVGKSLVAPWVLGCAGLVFLAGGMLFLSKAMGAGESASNWLGGIFILALALIFHYSVFVDDLSRWSGTSIGSLSAGEITRIGVVAVDLFFVLAWILHRTTFVGDEPGPFWKKWDHVEPQRKQRVGCFIMLTPLFLAIALHYSGVLDKIGAAFGQRQAGQPGQPAVAGPTRALSEYSGWWDGAHNMFGAGWVTRIIVRVDGKNVYMQPWNWCPPQYCDEGEHPAKIIGKNENEVSSIVLTRVENGVTRTIQLSPNGTNPNMLVISEQRMRGKDWNTNQQSASGIKRVK